VTEQNKAVYRRWVDALNERDFDMVGEIFTDPFTHSG
jgi:ketosteroid isomerase-like protein